YAEQHTAGRLTLSLEFRSVMGRRTGAEPRPSGQGLSPPTAEVPTRRLLTVAQVSTSTLCAAADVTGALTGSAVRAGARDPLASAWLVPVSYDCPERTLRAVASCLASGQHHIVLAFPPPLSPHAVRWMADHVLTGLPGGPVAVGSEMTGPAYDAAAMVDAGRWSKSGVGRALSQNTGVPRV
ncbi:MAG: hypothetical protein ACRCYU_22165, partial [Nocardioides sp.]